MFVCVYVCMCACVCVGRNQCLCWSFAMCSDHSALLEREMLDIQLHWEKIRAR